MTGDDKILCEIEVAGFGHPIQSYGKKRKGRLGPLKGRLNDTQMEVQRKKRVMIHLFPKKYHIKSFFSFCMSMKDEGNSLLFPLVVGKNIMADLEEIMKAFHSTSFSYPHISKT